jgi:hypothetical protein
LPRQRGGEASSNLPEAKFHAINKSRDGAFQPLDGDPVNEIVGKLFDQVRSFKTSPLMKKDGPILAMLQFNLDYSGQDVCREFTTWLTSTGIIQGSIFDEKAPISDATLQERAQLTLPQESFNKCMSWAEQSCDNLLKSQLSFVHAAVNLAIASAKTELVARELQRPKVAGSVEGPTGEQVTSEQASALKLVRSNFDGFTNFMTVSSSKLSEPLIDGQIHLDITKHLFSGRSVEQIALQVPWAFGVAHPSLLSVFIFRVGWPVLVQCPRR